MKPDICVIGTAGHIDHGKTSLVKALTGVDCDRLLEEKKRGITIDLGFAHLPLPNGGVAGIVDAPGHQKFIRNMLAGAGGVDVALLVVAADDSVMPQTVEHLAILSLMGVKRGVAAITKADLVDKETLDIARSEIEELLKTSPLKGAKLIPVSTVTGMGIDELKAELFTLAALPSSRKSDAFFRMPIDRAFHIKGHGVVVTGTVYSGSVSADEKLVIVPGGAAARTRMIQIHDEPAESASAGSRAALNISGPEKSEIRRGMVILHPAIAREYTSFAAELYCHDSSPTPFHHGKSYLLHVHTEESECMVILESGKTLKQGEKCFASIKLNTAANLVYGDRFVIRSSSGQHTIGGGVILYPGHGDGGRKELLSNRPALEDLAKGIETGVAAIVRTRPWGIHADELMAVFNVKRKSLEGLVKLVPGGAFFEWKGGSFVYLQDEAKRITGLLADEVAKFHKQNPAVTGVEETQLAKSAIGFMETSLAEYWIRRAVSSKVLEFAGPLLRIPGRKAVFSGSDETARASILNVFKEGGFTPPKAATVHEAAQVAKNDAAKIIRTLIQSGELVTVAPDFTIHSDALNSAKEVLLAEMDKEGAVDTARYRDILGSGRKVAIDLLEYFDSTGLTKRVDNKGRRILA